MEVPNTTHSHTQIQSNRAATIVRCMITALIIFFIVLSTASLLAWYIIHPRIPKFHFKSLSVSNFTILDTKLVAKYQMTFVVYNPNQNINLWFSNLDVSIAYKNCELSTSNYVHSFPLQKMGRAEKFVELETKASNARAIGGKHVEEIYLSGNQVVFNVKMRIWAKFRGGKWISKERLVKVGCKNLRVGFKDKSFVNGTSGKLTNGDGADCHSFFSDS